MCISLYAPLLLVCARESPRLLLLGRRERGRDVEAESYLVKNRLRAAHLVPFARTTSGLMHSARWKRASVCAPLGRRRRRRLLLLLGSSPATGLEERAIDLLERCVYRVVAGRRRRFSQFGPDSYRRRYTEKGPEKREKERERTRSYRCGR